MNKVIAALIMCFPAASILAHPGHGPLDTHILHYFFSLDHLLFLVVFGVVVYAVRKRIVTSRRQEVANIRRHARNVNRSRDH